MKKYEFQEQYDAIQLSLNEFIKDTPELNKIINEVYLKFTNENDRVVFKLIICNTSGGESRYQWSISKYQDCCGIKVVSDLTSIAPHKKNTYVKFLPIITTFLILRQYRAAIATFAYNAYPVKLIRTIDYLNEKLFVNPIQPIAAYNPNSGNIIYTYMVPIRPMILKHPNTTQIFKPEVIKKFDDIHDEAKNSIGGSFTISNWDFYKNQGAPYDTKIAVNQRLTEYFIDLAKTYFTIFIS